MTPFAKNKKIFNTIVQSITVDVVNLFSVAQFSTKIFLHNIAVFWNLLSTSPNIAILPSPLVYPIGSDIAFIRRITSSRKSYIATSETAETAFNIILNFFTTYFANAFKIMSSHSLIIPKYVTVVNGWQPTGKKRS